VVSCAPRLPNMNPEALTTEDAMGWIAVQICPWCKRGPFRSLGLHIWQAHGYSADECRKLWGLQHGQPLADPDLSADLSEIHKRLGSAKRLPKKTPTEMAELARRGRGRPKRAQWRLARQRPLVHGEGGWGYERGCRCADCKAAHARHEDARRRAMGVPKRRPAEHGTYSKYTDGCRCGPCRAASAAYARGLRARKRMR